MSTGTLDRRVETRPLPLDRVVKWLPRDDAFYLLAAVLTSASAEPLVVTREALLRVERHLRMPGRASGCGVLLGATCVCPRTRIRYLLVESAVGAVMSITEQESSATTIARLRALMTEVQRRGKRQVVGWYRGGAAIVPRVSPRDVAVHHELFADPWHVALLRDGVGSGHSGAFVRVEPVEERAYLTPFHELLPRKGWREREAGHTAVAWRNYRAEREAEVVPLAEVMAVPNGRSDGVPAARAVDPVVEAGPIRIDLGRHSRERGNPVAFAPPPQPQPSSPPPPVASPVQSGMQGQATSTVDSSSPAPCELEAASETVAPAPPEPLEFIWVPPRVPAGGSAAPETRRVWLWAAVILVGLAVLMVAWHVVR